jgi:hypothetical protein
MGYMEAIQASSRGIRGGTGVTFLPFLAIPLLAPLLPLPLESSAREKNSTETLHHPNRSPVISPDVGRRTVSEGLMDCEHGDGERSPELGE